VKQVLMVAALYPPAAGGGVYRTLGFVRHLGAHGFRPVVLTGTGEGAWVTDPELSPGPDPVEVVRVGGAALTRGRGGSARRSLWQMGLGWLATRLLVPDTYVGWLKPAVRAGLERLGRGDVQALYSTSPPDTDHLVALELRRATGLPWVADFRDPWIGLGYREPLTPWHRAAHLSRLRSVLRGADAVVASTEGTRGWLARMAGPEAPPRRLEVIPNGYEEEEWRDVVPRRFDHFTVLHAGRLSSDRTLEPFLDGLQAFIAREPSRRARTRVLLLGPHDVSEAHRVARRALADVVRFEGQRPHRETLQMEAGAHALLLLKHRSERFRELIPGKLYEYLAAGRPVLAVVPEGPAAELVRGMGCGWVVPPDSPSRVADALESAWRGEAPPRHAPADREAYTRRNLAARLARILEELT
jgi:glycosyltransferase involved in cell wall biosynthesis